MSVTVHHGDSREVLKGLADASIDSVVCDPPYALVSIGKRFGKEGSAPATAGKTGAYQRASAGFMGQKWDTGETAFAVEFWAEVYRVLKPGGHVVAFSATRTYHRMACAIEDAGFEMRDMIAWLYGSGFPKSHDVAKGIDKRNGDVRPVTGSRKKLQSYGANDVFGSGPDKGGVQLLTSAASAASAAWDGWGTALKPALEPIVLARKPLAGTVASNVLEHGTGALNIDGCRVETEEDQRRPSAGGENGLVGTSTFKIRERKIEEQARHSGRWPANVVHDGSDEVVRAFPQTAPSTIGNPRGAAAGEGWGMTATGAEYADAGSAARFFYSAKADAEDRLGSKHPTVKPVDLMRWLCRLVTPPGGVILDPFAGSGTTGLAAMAEGFNAILIEREADYVADIHRRIAWAKGEGRLTAQEMARDVRPREAAGDTLPLFATHPAPPNRADGEDEVEAA